MSTTLDNPATIEAMPPPNEDHPVRAVRTLTEQMAALHTDAVQAIESETEDLDSALKAANLLCKATQRLAEASTTTRTQALGKLWETQKTSLRQLAGKIGMSKSRVDQMLREHREETP